MYFNWILVYDLSICIVNQRRYAILIFIPGYYTGDKKLIDFIRNCYSFKEIWSPFVFSF
jgi:hypothetical protein